MIWILFVIVILLVLWSIRQNRLLNEIKRRYEVLLNATQFHHKFNILNSRRSIITGLKKKEDTIAYNINKGYEIYIAIDDDSTVDAAMYVFLHELAHTTVDEYDHSENFWANFKELRQVAVQAGIYTPITEIMYCGTSIKDSLTSF